VNAIIEPCSVEGQKKWLRVEKYLFLKELKGKEGRLERSRESKIEYHIEEGECMKC
jgi:hypothetical protein